VSKSDDRHQAKLERQHAEAKRRERIDKLRHERDREMRALWERWQARISQARAR
jgi:hypothetical protein